MNIGIVTAWFERGAAYVSRQYRQVLEKEHSVFIYARAGDYLIGNPTWDDDKVTWGKRSNLPVPSAIDRNDFEAWIKTKQIDIVFFNEQQWWEPLSWCASLGVKTGAYVDYYTEETVPFFASYDFLICNTKRHFSAFSWHPQVFYIPWGTDTNLFFPRSYSPVNLNKVTFFHSCGYSPIRKGTDFVITAFSRMTQAACLVIHSQIDLQAMIPTLSATIHKLQNQGTLQLINKTVTAPGLYHLGDVYVGPSRLEGIGLPLIESQACGLPLVTCNNPPMNEFIAEETGSIIDVDRFWSRKDGYYWPQCAPKIDDLVDVLDRYALAFSKIEDLKLRTRQYAEKHFNWFNNAKTLNSIFSDSERLSSKQNIIKEALDFERRKQGIQYRLSLRYPWLWRTYQCFQSSNFFSRFL